MSDTTGSRPVDPLLAGVEPEPAQVAVNGLLVISPDTKLGRRERKQLAAGEQHAAKGRHPTSRPIAVIDPERIIDPELRQRLHPDWAESSETESSETESSENLTRRAGRVRRTVWPILVTGLLVAALFVFVFPTRTYLAQREETQRTQTQLDILDAQNDALSRESPRFRPTRRSRGSRVSSSTSSDRASKRSRCCPLPRSPTCLPASRSTSFASCSAALQRGDPTVG